MISLPDNARQLDNRLPLMTEKLQILTRRSGYPARFKIKTPARVVRDLSLHNARVIHCGQAEQTDNIITGFAETVLT